MDTNLDFLATKSKELVEKQIASYRQQHTTASSIIAIVALFIPLFINGLDDAYDWIKYVSIISVLLFVISICLLLFHVFRAHALNQALNFDEFQDLVNANDIEKTMLLEIGANKSSFQLNKKILIKRNKYYNSAVIMTICGIIISVTLLMINRFFKPNKKKAPTQIEVINKIAIADSTKVDTIFITKYIPPTHQNNKRCYSTKTITVNQTVGTQNIQNINN